MNETLNKTSHEERQYLTFLMGQDQYSLDIMMVKEIIAYSDVMKVPMLPPYIKGVINLRNKVVPVIDLSMRFGKGETDIGKLTCIIIIELEKGDKRVEIGIVVDSVSEVINLNETEIEQTPDFGDDVHADFISGMGRIGSKFIIMLNVSKVLNVQDIKYIEKATKDGLEILSENKE